MKLDRDWRRWCVVTLLLGWCALQPPGFARAATGEDDSDATTRETVDTATPATDDESPAPDAESPTADADTGVDAERDAEQAGMLTTEIFVTGIMRLRKTGYIIATLHPVDRTDKPVPQRIELVFSSECAVGATCGNARATFTDVPADTKHTLLVCHNNSGNACITDSDGQLKDIGVREEIIPVSAAISYDLAGLY